MNSLGVGCAAVCAAAETRAHHISPAAEAGARNLMTHIVSARSREPAGWRARARSAATALCTITAIATLAGCAWLDVKERTLIYRPTPGHPDAFTALRSGDETYLISVPGARPGT